MLWKRQARPTIPEGTVEWIMLPSSPSIRSRICAPKGERPRSAVSTVVVFIRSSPRLKLESARAKAESPGWGKPYE